MYKVALIRLETSLRVLPLSDQNHFIPMGLGVILAVGSIRFSIEALSFKMLLTDRAAETVRVVGIAQGLYPPIAGFNGEMAREALGCEQLVPVCFAIRLPILDKERSATERVPTVSTHETIRVPLAIQGRQTVSHDGT